MYFNSPYGRFTKFLTNQDSNYTQYLKKMLWSNFIISLYRLKFCILTNHMIGKLHKRKEFLQYTNPFIKKYFWYFLYARHETSWQVLYITVRKMAIDPAWVLWEDVTPVPHFWASCLLFLLLLWYSLEHVWTVPRLGSPARTSTSHPQLASPGNETSWGVTQYFFICTPENRQIP